MNSGSKLDQDSLILFNAMAGDVHYDLDFDNVGVFGFELRPNENKRGLRVAAEGADGADDNRNRRIHKSVVYVAKR